MAPADVVECFQAYLQRSGLSVSRAQFEANLAAKRLDPVFLGDVRPLLRQDAPSQPHLLLETFRLLVQGAVGVTRRGQLLRPLLAQPGAESSGRLRELVHLQIALLDLEKEQVSVEQLVRRGLAAQQSMGALEPRLRLGDLRLRSERTVALAGLDQIREGLLRYAKAEAALPGWGELDLTTLAPLTPRYIDSSDLVLGALREQRLDLYVPMPHPQEERGETEESPAQDFIIAATLAYDPGTRFVITRNDITFYAESSR